MKGKIKCPLCKTLMKKEFWYVRCPKCRYVVQYSEIWWIDED